MSLIRFIFSGDTKQLEGAANRAKAQVAQLKSEARAATSTFAKYTAGAAAAGVAVAAHLVNQSRQAIDAQAKLSRSINATVAELDIITQAGDRSGVAFDKVAQATKDLTRRLSQAAANGGPTADAIERLHTTASELQALPLDQRIAEINSRINEFIPAAEQAAVAGALFGEEGSLAMRRIDPETIKLAAANIKAFGTALSDIEVAQVEAANDSIARVGQAVDGAVNKFTAELSPVLDAIAQQFTDATKEAGGVGEAASSAFDVVVKGAAFGMDAVEGIKRTFQIAGQAVAVFALAAKRAMYGFAESIVTGPIEQINTLVEMANKLPKVDLPTVEIPAFVDGMRDEMALTEGAIREGWESIKATLMEPLPGEQFLRFVEDARAASKAAAEQTLADRAEHDELALAQLAEASAAQAEVQGMADAKQFEEQRKAANARMKLAEQEARARRKVLGDTLSGLTTLMNSENRKMFEVGKAAAISQAVINTYESATGAYKALAGIPIVGPALGAAAAAAAVATGMANVQAIRSQSFGTGGAAAPATQSNTQAVNSATTPAEPSGGGGCGATVTLAGLDPDAQYSGRGLIGALQEAIDNGATLRLA